MPDTTRLPLFLLPLAALPGEEVPLHVFEPRYRALMEHCLSTGEEFGIVLTDDGGVRETGCAARVQRVVNRHDDGTLDVMTIGTRRFKLAGDVEEDEFPHAPASWVHDHPAGPHEEDADPAGALKLFGELSERVTGSVTELHAAEADDQASFRIATRVAFGSAAKQGLLEMRSEAQRLDLLERLLRAALARLAQVDLRQAQASSNGKVHFE